MGIGFDPEELFRRRRPRVVGNGTGLPRVPHWRRWALVAAVIVLVAVFFWILGLRAEYLFYSSLQHGNVFWTPFWAQVILFVVGFLITGGLVGFSVAGWVLAARNLDTRFGRITIWSGIGVAVIAGVAGGAFASSQWQDVLLWLHASPFGKSDPVFHQDFSFFVFTLPIIDDVSALLWGGVIVGLLGAAALALFAIAVDRSPAEIGIAMQPPAGKTARHALAVAGRHFGIMLAALLVLAAGGAHFGIYHLATNQHDTYSFVGPDATELNVTIPVLSALQYVALVLAAVVLLLSLRPRLRKPERTVAVAAGILLAWLVVAGLVQGIPAAIYEGASVNPNALQAQSPSISNFLEMSRQGWGLGNVADHPLSNVGPPTLQDLAADQGTLRNVRIQDYRQLPDAFNQIDRSRSYQTYPTITVDRYPDPSGNETEVMLGPREIAEQDIPNPSFLNSALQFTHGYGITAASVNAVGDEGKPQLLVGHQPLQKISADAPADLYFDGHAAADPRIYCGLDTTQAVVSGTTQPEFDYPTGESDAKYSAGAGEQGIAINNGIDKLAVSLHYFGGLDLFLNNSLTDRSRVLVHRAIADRVQTLAPFLTVDSDPYIVADPQSNHLMWIADAYVSSDRFPESYQLSDGTSYMRNAVKAVIDAKTCAITLYAVDLNEPITAAWNAIYPGLMVPISQMPSSLVAHLRYPEDLFTNQAHAYALVHISPKNPDVFFNGSDRYRISEEQINGQTQETQPYYIEATLPGRTKPEFLLFQTFSPATSGGGSAANNMTAWLAATNDYSHGPPQLVAVRLSNADNVLGPLQFDNNINTDPTISNAITLLGQHGSQVVLGNVIVLPFNNDSFLYVRPFYVLAASSGGGTAFPQLRRVIVGTQNQVASGDTFAEALQTLFNTNTPIPGLPASNSPTTPNPAPPSPPQPSAQPAPGTTLSSQEQQLLNDLLNHQASAEAALQQGDFATFGKEEAAVKADADQLRSLLGQSSSSPSPTP